MFTKDTRQRMILYDRMRNDQLKVSQLLRNCRSLKSKIKRNQRTLSPNRIVTRPEIRKNEDPLFRLVLRFEPYENLSFSTFYTVLILWSRFLAGAQGFQPLRRIRCRLLCRRTVYFIVTQQKRNYQYHLLLTIFVFITPIFLVLRYSIHWPSRNTNE